MLPVSTTNPRRTYSGHDLHPDSYVIDSVPPSDWNAETPQEVYEANNTTEEIK